MFSESKVEVINALGQLVFERNVESSGTSPVVVNLEDLKAGYYIMKVSNASRAGSCKMVKY
jgi:hypothetical protein